MNVRVRTEFNKIGLYHSISLYLEDKKIVEVKPKRISEISNEYFSNLYDIMIPHIIEFTSRTEVELDHCEYNANIDLDKLIVEMRNFVNNSCNKLIINEYNNSIREA